MLIIKLFFVTWVFFFKADVLNSYFMFSLMFMGYAIGGVYYNFSNGYYGKFLEFYHLPNYEVEIIIEMSLLYCLAFYILFTLGYFRFAINRTGFSIKYSNQTVSNFLIFLYNFKSILLYPIAVVVIAYWCYVCIVSAGSIFNAIVFFQLFPHFIEESGLSIAPYIIFYSIVYLLFVIDIENRGSPTKLTLSFAVVGLLMILSTARISQGASFLLTLLLFYYFYSTKARKNAVYMFLCIVFLGISVHFLRELSNHYYLMGDLSLEIDGVLKTVIGGGNIADLQQLVIVKDIFRDGSYEYGATYFHWLNNLFGKYFGLEPTSLGIKIYDAIVPKGSSSGAPTPGALGELYANFYYYGLLLAPAIGFVFSYIDRISLTSSSPWVKISYTMFLSFFIFLYPKVDSTMIINFIWAFVPFYIMIGAFSVVYLVVKKPMVD